MVIIAEAQNYNENILISEKIINEMFNICLCALNPRQLFIDNINLSSIHSPYTLLYKLNEFVFSPFHSEPLQ